MKSFFSNIKGDSFGGITAGIVALPLALAFGVQSGMGANAGLYGAIALGFFAVIFGGTNTQISGPTGPITVVSAAFIAVAIQHFGSLENALGIIILTFFLAGVFQILFGILKIGKYVKYIPYPVLSGFMSGIGVIIIVLQIFPMLGLNSPGKILDVITHLPNAVKETNYYSLIITLTTILIIYIFPKITKTIPSSLIALISVTALVFFMKIEIPLIGEIPSGLPELKIVSIINIDFSDLSMILIPALTLAGLGTIDSLLTSVVADNITKTKHNSNKELIGQGIGNIASSLIGGIPGAGATMRTVVNVKSGGRTKLSGIIHAILLVLILLGLGKFVSYIPLSVLAGVLITVGIGIIDRKGIIDLLHIPKTDAIILVIVFILTVFVDLLQAVGIGMVIASVLFMKKASDLIETGTKVAPISKHDKEIPWEDEKDLIEENLNKVFIKRLDGPIFFGAVSKFFELFNSIPKETQVVIIRMRKVPFIDQSGLYSLETAISDLQSRGIIVVITMIQAQPLIMLKKVKMIPGLIPEKHLFDNFEDCSVWLKDFFKTE